MSRTSDEHAIVTKSWSCNATNKYIYMDICIITHVNVDRHTANVHKYADMLADGSANTYTQVHRHVQRKHIYMHAHKSTKDVKHTYRGVWKTCLAQ